MCARKVLWDCLLKWRTAGTFGSKSTYVYFVRETKIYRHMAWEENDNGDSARCVPRTKSSLSKLLEVVKAERLVINSVSRTLQPIRNGKNRRKFPDSKRDVRVEFTVTSQSGKVSLPICYEEYAGEDETPLVRYTLGVLSIQRYSSEGKLLPGELGDSSYRCCPLLEHKTGSRKKVYGFWFRCFVCATFQVTIAIKLCGLKYLAFNAGKIDTLIGCNDCSVNTKVFEIANCPRANGKSKIVRECQLVAKIFPALYTNDDYKTFVSTVKDLRSSELEIFLSQSMDKDLDPDLKVVVLLEKSLEACRKGAIEKAKQTVKSAVDLIGKCTNKVLLTGRAYLYLAQIHLKDGCLGNAEDCLGIARKKLQNIESCEDVGDLWYQEGELLMAFIKKVPRFAAQLIPEARNKFQQAALYYEEGVSTGGVVDKLCCSHLQLASLACQEKSCAKSSSMTYDAITCMQGHIKLVQAHLGVLSQRTQFEYLLCYSKLLLEMNLLEQARESLKAALQITETSTFTEGVVLDSMVVEQMYDQLYRCSSPHMDGHVSQIVEMTSATTEDDDRMSLGYLGDIST